MAFQAMAQEPSIFTDPEDGALDASEWLLDKKGFLPVPIIVTEPAIGYGAGAALLWFRESLGERRAQGRLTPPDIFGGVLAATENGTTLAGAFGMVTFAQEYWRWRGFIGRPDVNLDFYGRQHPTKIGYNLEGWATRRSSFMRRLGESENFVGARWIYLDFDASFDRYAPGAGARPGGRAITSSGLGVFFEHDSRDNFFTPRAAGRATVEAMFYSPDIGSDEKYETYRAQVLGYFPMGRISSSAAASTRARRAATCRSTSCRSSRCAAFRSSATRTRTSALAEVELRWNVTPRWALVGFLGAGRAWGPAPASRTATRSAPGASASDAWWRGAWASTWASTSRAGPEETAIYIQAGSAWR